MRSATQRIHVRISVEIIYLYEICMRVCVCVKIFVEACNIFTICCSNVTTNFCEKNRAFSRTCIKKI